MPSMTVNCLFPTAHGNAIEAGWEEMGMIPAIFMNPRYNKLSRLTKGLSNTVHTIEYTDFDTDGLDALRIQTDEIHTWMRYFPGHDVREFFYLNYPNIRKPLLALHGLDPQGFHPVINVSEALVYFKDPLHKHYGQVGEVVYHDWRDSGEIGLQFTNGTETIIDDQSDGFSYWRKLPQVTSTPEI